MFLKISEMFIGKHLHWILFLISCRLEGHNFNKKGTPPQLFPVITKFLRTAFCMEHLQLLIRKTQEKEGPQGNIFKFFLIDTLETTF